MSWNERKNQGSAAPLPISFTSIRQTQGASFSLASPQTFGTAKSSIASYATAPSQPRSYMQNLPAYNRPSGALHMEKGIRLAGEPRLQEATDKILLEVYKFEDLKGVQNPALRSHFRMWVERILATSHDPGALKAVYSKHITASYIKDLADTILVFSIGKDMGIINLTDPSKQETLREDVASIVQQFLALRKRQAIFEFAPAFSSKWLNHLHSRSILLDPEEELDWSGRGQHVEYERGEQDNIPLISERILGHSGSAIVDSVKCRRIRLARKKISCHCRLKKETAISEVQQLQLLLHSHIVRVVGTYTIGKFLAILLYPATQWDLDEFMDDLQSKESKINAIMPMQSEQARNHTLSAFFGCLSHAISYIHNHNVKHMDIKPKNLLVRPDRKGTYKIYIADFGIARAYKSANELCTDSPISFTRAYAAPEVVAQEKRDASADIFSLGCVFMEMMATMLSSPAEDHRLKLLELRQFNPDDPSFQANIEVLQRWCFEVLEMSFRSGKGSTELSPAFVGLVPEMINEAPEMRPAASELELVTTELCCSNCNNGPEPFEAAGPWEL